MRRSRIILTIGVFASLVLSAYPGLGAEPSMADYTCYPIFQVSTVEPNIFIILDNSGSMNFQAYTGAYDHNTEYYGYFEPYKKYTYGSNVFERDASGAWDGNFLNWLTMRRVDVARKVLMGGLATSRVGGGNQTNIGETPAQSNRDFTKNYDDTDGVTPLSAGTSYAYLVDAGYFYVDADSNGTYSSDEIYVIKVDKDMNLYPDEAYNFNADGNLAGILQKIGSKARWGLEFFNYGTGNLESGGSIIRTIGTNMTDLITSIQNTACSTWTPLAEAYYVGVQYYKQEAVQDGLDYPNNVIPDDKVGQDPYYNGTEFVHCAKGFVIMLTDGASTKDMMIPDSLKDYDNDGNDPGSYPDAGSDYLDDIALYARTTDLRSSTVGKTALDGDQNIILYTIYAFGDDPDAEGLLKDAAKNGGFIDKDGDNRPNLQEEWDADTNGVPDTYFKADNGYELEAKMLQAVNDILKRAASGTAVSVLATSGEGEGNLIQAYFRPVVPTGLTEVKWVGYLQSLWVDPYGNLREDTIHDQALDVEGDKVITYFLDTATGDTKIKRFSVSHVDPYPDVDSDPYEVLELHEIIPLWEAGSLLAQRSANDRKVFTYIDKDQDGIVDETANNPFNDSGEVVKFHTDSASSIKPYLGVKDDATWSYLGANHDNRVTNLINYIRGNDISSLRTRTIDGNVWKLGDIVHSTPVSISKPPDNFHIIYGDESYEAYYDAVKDRETVVYVGANDGMLHAFTSWEYDVATKEYTRPTVAPGTENIGDELWAYIPQSLLAHLKWLPSPDYTHVYYVDLKPKVFDAKILPDDTHYTDTDTDDNWGTLLLCGFNMGGRHIQAEDDFDYNAGTSDTVTDFYPSYACIDVTDPRNPTLLWDRTYTDLEMTTSTPAIVKVKDKWFAVFGSGPSDCDGDSAKEGHIFVVDLKTGDAYSNVAQFGAGATNGWLFETNESDAFMNSPASLDKNLNYNVDAIYFGESYYSGSWKGKLYKVTVPWVDGSGNYDGSDVSNYSDDPLDSTNPWQLSTFFDATKPITAPVALSLDTYGNVWVYGGSGRYLGTDDKSNSDTQYIFGIKDPFFNPQTERSTYYHEYSSNLTLGLSNLFDADPYIITTDGMVSGGLSRITNWDDLLAAVRNTEDQGTYPDYFDGWYRTLSTSKERILAKPSLLGGIVFVPSFVPNEDICGFGGNSYFYGLYYETGTPYYEPVFETGTATIEIDGQQMEKVLGKIELGSGKASSLGVQVGMEEGAKGFVQQSTGTIVSETISPAFNIKSSLRSWQEK
jgi:type IV pilus assembly protein PilY1